MTDKQIIIDDIDVSGCASYMDNGECINENVYPDYCKACSNCTYKLEQQLKAKEQECEELKNAYTRLNSLYNDNCNFTDKLEQTLTEIKEIAEENFYFLDCYYRFILEKILQKISECEVKNEHS